MWSDQHLLLVLRCLRLCQRRPRRPCQRHPPALRVPQEEANQLHQRGGLAGQLLGGEWNRGEAVCDDQSGPERCGYQIVRHWVSSQKLPPTPQHSKPTNQSQRSIPGRSIPRSSIPRRSIPRWRCWPMVRLNSPTVKVEKEVLLIFYCPLVLKFWCSFRFVTNCALIMALVLWLLYGMRQ